MGEAFAHVIFGLANPTVGILNVGAEEQKGNDGVRGAAQILRNSNLPMAFHGFVEGDDISKGTVDVVVTDGFTGNIALKTAEGTARLVGTWLRQALKRSVLSKFGAVMASGALNVLRRKLDPRAQNGGVFLGLNGVVVTDGFTGNIALKTAEGTAKLYTEFLRSAIKSSLLAQFGMLFAKPVISQVMSRTDPRRYNGALFVGLNGVAVKSHGGTDPVGFANAIGVAVDMVARDLNRRIAQELDRVAAQAQASPDSPPRDAAASE